MSTRESNHYAKMKSRTVVEDLKVARERANILRDAPRLVSLAVAKGWIQFPSTQLAALGCSVPKVRTHLHVNHLWDDGDYRRTYFAAKKRAQQNGWAFTWDKARQINSSEPNTPPVIPRNGRTLDRAYKRAYAAAYQRAYKHNWPFTWDPTTQRNTSEPIAPSPISVHPCPSVVKTP